MASARRSSAVKQKGQAAPKRSVFRGSEAHWSGAGRPKPRRPMPRRDAHAPVSAVEQNPGQGQVQANLPVLLVAKKDFPPVFCR
eukprot:scaffold351_cov248-Pinguiococcus_pyrenoidosus.AAC.8